MNIARSCRVPVLLITIFCFMVLLGPNAFAATIKVNGSVSNKSGQPIKAATVAIEVAGNLGYIYQNTVFTETNSYGRYETTLSIPVDTYYQISVLVFRRYAPCYVPDFKATAGPVADGSNLTFNFTLKQLSTGAVVEGFLRDRRFGHPIVTSGVNTQVYNVGPIVRSFSNGYYIRVLDLKDDTPKEVTLQYSNGYSGLRYPVTSKKITIKPGQTSKVDFSILQDKENAAYIFGSVVNGTNGQPIPYDSVFFNPVGYNYPTPTTAITTDQFGRFIQDVNLSWLNSTGYVGVSTNGYYGSVNGEGDIYFWESRIIAIPSLGTAKEVNFELVPKAQN